MNYTKHIMVDYVSKNDGKGQQSMWVADVQLAIKEFEKDFNCRVIGW